MERTRHPGVFRRGGSYVAAVMYRDGAGKKKYKWLSAPSLKAAVTARRAMLNQLDAGVKPDASRMTVGDFSALWLADVATRLRPLTVRGYRSLLRRHILPAIGGSKLRDVDREALRKLYASLPSDALRSRVHAALSAMFGYAVKDMAVLVANPCGTVRRPRYRSPEAPHLDPAGSKDLLGAAAGTPLEAGVVLGLAGGLRIGEVVAVRWGDLEDDGTLTVRRSAHGETKSGNVRSLTLPSPATATLRRIKLAQAESLLSVGVRLGPDTPVVADPIGRAVNVETFRRGFKAFAAERGFDITFHALRHSNAIAMLVAGVDPKTAASRLGHSSPAMLFKTYSHYIRSADKTAADKLGAILSG